MPSWDITISFVDYFDVMFWIKVNSKIKDTLELGPTIDEIKYS